MFDEQQYALLDFGGGRKLERFGPYVLDRPCPAAETETLAHYELWPQSIARFVRSAADSGAWSPSHALPDAWTIEHQPWERDRQAPHLRFELRPTEFGHLGIFPEQAANWEWLFDWLSRGSAGPRVLNLFAYTGGSTLAAAAAGGQVVHIDAAENIVNWARRNAELSELDTAPVRWITEHVPRFVARELKRGNRYDTIILDPPSYGHGPKGEAWKLADDLNRLLRDCAELLTGSGRPAIVLSCHTTRWKATDLRELLAAAVAKLLRGQLDVDHLWLTTPAGRRLPSGLVARWYAE